MLTFFHSHVSQLCSFDTCYNLSSKESVSLIRLARSAKSSERSQVFSQSLTKKRSGLSHLRPRKNQIKSQKGRGYAPVSLKTTLDEGIAAHSRFHRPNRRIVESQGKSPQLIAISFTARVSKYLIVLDFGALRTKRLS